VSKILRQKKNTFVLVLGRTQKKTNFWIDSFLLSPPPFEILPYDSKKRPPKKTRKHQRILLCVLCVSLIVALRRRRHQKKKQSFIVWCRRHLGAIENDTPSFARALVREGPSPHQLKKEEKRRKKVGVCWTRARKNARYWRLLSFVE